LADLADLGVHANAIKALGAAGVDMHMLRQMDQDQLVAIKGIGKASAHDIQEALGL
jgi:hypothetical protein